MPCWVAPVVAAELWGVSLDSLLLAIADGTVPSRREYGFVLVDVAPEGVAPQAPKREGPPPPTYVAVADEAPREPEIPVAVPWDIREPGPEPVSRVPEVVPESIPEIGNDELPPLDEEEDDEPIGNWRQVRSTVGRSRKPPARTPPPASFAA